MRFIDCSISAILSASELTSFWWNPSPMGLRFYVTFWFPGEKVFVDEQTPTGLFI